MASKGPARSATGLEDMLKFTILIKIITLVVTVHKLDGGDKTVLWGPRL